MQGLYLPQDVIKAAAGQYAVELPCMYSQGGSMGMQDGGGIVKEFSTSPSASSSCKMETPRRSRLAARFDASVSPSSVERRE